MLDRNLFGRLQATADTAIWKAHSDVFSWIRRGKLAIPPEEDFVAAFILNALPDIAVNWQVLLAISSMKISMTGVFCHQTPMAEFIYSGHAEKCEIADLLIVRRHSKNGVMVRQVAVLIQAKKTSNGEIEMLGSDLKQLHLYQNWPKFTLHSVKAPKTDFCIGLDSRQSLIAGISDSNPCPSNNKSWPGFCPWTLMAPAQKGWGEISLSQLMLKLLLFESGRDFFEPGTTGCHWSDLINYLLDVTFHKKLVTRDMRSRAPRGATFNFNRTIALCHDKDLPSVIVPMDLVVGHGGVGDPPNIENEFNQFIDGGEGRTIIIETSEGEARTDKRNMNPLN